MASIIATIGTQSPVQPLKIDPIDKFIFDGIQSRFLEVFDAASVWTTSTDKVRPLDRLFPAKQGQSVTYPYAFLKIASWELSTDRRNLRDSTLRGVPVTTSNDTKSYLAATFLPVNFSVSVEFVTNDFRSVLDFSRKWLLAAKTGRLSFQVDYGLTSLNIPLQLDTNVSFPTREGTPEEVQEYVAEVTFVALGYISEPTVVQVGVVDTLVVSASLGYSVRPGVISESVWSISTKPRVTG